MAIPVNTTALENQKFRESASVSGQVGVVVVGPNGETIGGPTSSNPAYVQEVNTSVAEDNTNGVIAMASKPLATTTYSWSRAVDYASNVTANVKASAGCIKSVYCHNTNAAARYIQIHNTSTTPSGGAVPTFSFLVPTGGATLIGDDFFGEQGYYCSSGIAFAFSTTETTYTAGSAGDQTTFVMYK